MAAIGTALMGRVMGHSEAEKAFRPWWDSLEDFLIYGLVMLGIIIVPTAIITGTPIDCNYCQADHCTGEGKFKNLTLTNEGKEDPKFNAWWVKKYCTMSGAVAPFMLYFPYFLLIIAMLLVFIERVFLKAFKAGSKLDKFYSLLVKEKVLKVESGNAYEAGDTVDGREAVEIRESFKGSTSYFLAYLLRTCCELLVAGALLFYMIWRGVPILEHSNTVICDVHDYYYECSGQPADFYKYILFITIAITCVYILCNCYNLLWLTFPCFGRLSRVMNAYRINMRDPGRGGSKSDKENLGELWDIYYNNRDLQLLLDLLATSSGVAPAIAIMTLFDTQFMNAMKPTIRYIAASRDLGIAEVQFQEPKTGVRAALADIPGVHLMYLAEIVPPADSSVVAFESAFVEEKEGELCTGIDIELAPLTGFVQKASFSGLKKDQKYTVKISTSVNGRTISQVSQEIDESHEKLPVDELTVENARKGINSAGDSAMA